MGGGRTSMARREEKALNRQRVEGKKGLLTAAPVSAESGMRRPTLLRQKPLHLPSFFTLFFSLFPAPRPDDGSGTYCMFGHNFEGYFFWK